MFNTAGAMVGETEGEGDAEAEGEASSPWLFSSLGATLAEASGSVSSSVGVPEFG
jgi:hypothetical protein